MRVLFAVDSFYPEVGGRETELWELSTRLARRGVEVRVVTGMPIHATLRVETIDGIQIYRYPWRRAFGTPIPRYADILEHVQWSDIVHTSTYSVAPYALSAARKLGKKCILTVQEVVGRTWFRAVRNPLLAAFFWGIEYWVVRGNFDAWHAISAFTAGKLRDYGISPERISMIPLGIDEGRWNSSIIGEDAAKAFGFSSELPVFLFFGRAGALKGLQVLLGAVEQLIQEGHGGTFGVGLVLGDHPPGERSRVVRDLEKRGLDAHVRVKPSLPLHSLVSLVRGASCVIVPSLSEGFGLSAAEACAAGVPVIASRAGALPEVVSGRHLLFPAGDIRRLAQMMRRALSNDFDEAPSKRFSWDDSVEHLLGLYQSLSGLVVSDSATAHPQLKNATR